MTRVIAPAGPSENLARLGEYSDRMHRGDVAAVEEFFDPEFRTHVSDRVEASRGTQTGADIRHHEVHYWQQARGAISDFEFHVDLLVEVEDLVISHWRITGVHDLGPFYDVEPTGDPVVIEGTAILRMHDGRIVEHWGGPHCPEGIGLGPKRSAHPTT